MNLSKLVSSIKLVDMRVLTLLAFVALQLSVFTCGFDIHVHAMASDTSHVAEHAHNTTNDHEKSALDHGCHVHASHSLVAVDAKYTENIQLVPAVECFALVAPSLKRIQFLIEYPPKYFHS